MEFAAWGGMLWDIRQRLYNFKIVAAIISILKSDGATTAHQVTMDSATAPTQSIQTS